ncbi:MAG: hypothetical protein Q9200_007666 [Gallowayella weberi]
MAGHTPRKPETRGRHRTYTQEEKEKMIHTVQEHRIDGKRLTFAEVLGAANIDTAGLRYEDRTIRKLFQEEHFHHRIAVQKKWLDEATAQLRCDFANDMLEARPEPKDWEDVRFSDECHFGWGPEGKI